MATQETQPYIKEHDGTKICFADTLTQAKNALSGEGMKEEENKSLAEGHLMLFGVEEWKKNDITGLKTAFVNHQHGRFNRLEIFGCELSKENQLAFAEVLEPDHLASIKQFDIDNTTLDAAGAGAIFNRVAQVPTIEHINLQGSINGKPDVIKAIAKEFETQEAIYKGLKHLDLKINELNADCGSHVATIVRGCVANDTHLDLFYNDLQATGTQHIAKIMSNPDVSITHLDLSCNNIGDDGAKAIADMLATNKCLKTLKLALNNISFEGAVPIFQVLGPQKEDEAVNRTLRELDISANVMKACAEITDDVAHPKQAEYDQVAADMDALETKIEEAEDDGQDVSGLEKELAVLNDQFNALATHIGQTRVDKYPELTALQDMIKHMHLTMFDFTGIELGRSQWGKFSAFLSFLRPKNANKEKRTIRFSIVDLMNEENLKIMEDKIWDNNKKDKFDFIDWRRRDDKKEEEK